MLRPLVLVLALAAMMLGPLARQVRAAGAEDGPTKNPLVVRNAAERILSAGLVGGILGLSTLSFYPKPEANIRNVFFGAGAGMILTILYMTMDVAATPLDNIEKDDNAQWRWSPYVDPTTGGTAGAIVSLRF